MAVGDQVIPRRAIVVLATAVVGAMLALGVGLAAGLGQVEADDLTVQHVDTPPCTAPVHAQRTGARVTFTGVDMDCDGLPAKATALASGEPVASNETTAEAGSFQITLPGPAGSIDEIQLIIGERAVQVILSD